MLFLENVSAICSQPMRATFCAVVETLSHAGFQLHWCVLNAFNCGAEQAPGQVQPTCTMTLLSLPPALVTQPS